MQRFQVTSLVALLFVIPALASVVRADEHDAAIEFFEKEIRPVLVDHCYDCHSADADDLKGGLRLDSQQGWQEGGDSGPAIVPGDPEGSLLLRAMKYEDDDVQMPPDAKLDAAIIDKFEQWIADGAADPREVAADLPDDREADSHWAFALPQKIKPAPSRAGGARPVDAYLNALRQQLEVVASTPTSRQALARRLYFDLTGLPPSYEQTQRFVNDPSPQAVTRLVDRLLGSPRFGERWARYWLDVARFADTKGYVFTEDRNYPDAFKYRDWVIESWNADRPYDDFLRMQLAADQASEDVGDLRAMGYLTLGRRFLNNRHDIIDDRIDVVMRGMQGLTVTCARCHDHKYDPIPMRDYYSLYGVFASSEEPGGDPSPLRMVDRAAPVQPVVFIRGNPANPGDAVPRQFLEVLSGDERKAFEQGSGRRELADAISSANNPLTARVMVNRVWGKLMGAYLVDTPSDFGVRSEAPALQPLLDYLAVELMRHDWSLKWLVREIVLSDAYQQSSSLVETATAITTVVREGEAPAEPPSFPTSARQEPRPPGIETATRATNDPTNQSYWRANRRRLDFEAMRDALLHVSGQLDSAEVGGASGQITGDQPSSRRTLYAFIDRQNLPGLFRVFDMAIPDTHSPKRFETTVPQQSLFLMNSPWSRTLAEGVVQQVNAIAGADRGEQIQSCFRVVLGRNSTDQETEASLTFLEQVGQDDENGLMQLALVLMWSNEFLFLD